MESSIVRDFQNLNVLTVQDFQRMDELVRDLTNALEETAKIQKARNSDSALCCNLVRRTSKKRRDKKRRTNSASLRDNVNFSEGSESSLDEALKDYMENVAQQSDSDDLVMAKRLSSLNFPHLSNHVAQAESDSVTETFSPLRPHRRRRKLKRMSVDLNVVEPVGAERIPKPKHKRQKSKLKNSDGTMMDVENLSNQNLIDIVAGKRKRRMKYSEGSFDNDQENSVSMECNNQASQESSTISTSSSSCSSSESDVGILTNDEAREGDDEQSDFFHEPGPACGIPGIIPWWEKEKLTDFEEKKDPVFESILTGSFEHLSTASQRNLKTRLTKLAKSHGREITAGRRRLKDRKSSYTMSRFLQDREKWSEMIQMKYNSLVASGSTTNACTTSGDIKRRRRTPPSSPVDDVIAVGEAAEPIPETNIGNRMLQSMGWTPGSGLGAGGSGIKDPVTAFMRPKRQGLGCSSNSAHPDSHH